MAVGTEEQDLELEGEDTEETEETGDESAESESTEGASGGDKRISDLQSKADKAEARANKAEAALAKSLKPGESAGSGKNDPEQAALMTELREASLDAVFGEFSELRDYAIDRALIEGSTRAEMREAATSLVGLIKSVETKARNKALREHGIKAEPAGATRQTPKNFSEMSNEDFEKEIARAKSGGMPIW